MKIVYLDYHHAAITGGHKYNDAFIKYLSDYSGVSVVYTPCCAKKYIGWKKIFAPLMELKIIKLLNRGDIVFWNDTAHNYHYLLALFVLLFKNVHSLIVIHHFPKYSSSLKGLFLKSIRFTYFSMCGAIIVPSPYSYDTAKKIYKKRKVFYIPLPFEKKYVVSSNVQTGSYLYVGTIEPRKGLHYLVDSLAIVKKRKSDCRFELNVVGKVVDEHYFLLLKDRISKYDLCDSINFWGRIDNDKLEKLYSRAEIFTFPSLLEGYGIVLVEALNHGIPIIAFNNSAMPYSVCDGENGFLVSNEDVEAFAEKILLLTGNTELRMKLQKGIQKSVSKLKTKEDFEAEIRSLYGTISSAAV